MLRSVAIVAVGFVTIAMTVMLGTMALVAAFHPGGLAVMGNPDLPATPVRSRWYLPLNLALSFAGAIAGGMVTAHLAILAPHRPLTALAAVLLVVGVVTAFLPSNASQPIWYKVAVPLVGIGGIAVAWFVVPA